MRWGSSRQRNKNLNFRILKSKHVKYLQFESLWHPHITQFEIVHIFVNNTLKLYQHKQ